MSPKEPHDYKNHKEISCIKFDVKQTKSKPSTTKTFSKMSLKKEEVHEHQNHKKSPCVKNDEKKSSPNLKTTSKLLSKKEDAHERKNHIKDDHDNDHHYKDPVQNIKKKSYKYPVKKDDFFEINVTSWKQVDPEKKCKKKSAGNKKYNISVLPQMQSTLTIKIKEGQKKNNLHHNKKLPVLDSVRATSKMIHSGKNKLESKSSLKQKKGLSHIKSASKVNIQSHSKIKLKSSLPDKTKMSPNESKIKTSNQQKG